MKVKIESPAELFGNASAITESLGYRSLVEHCLALLRKRAKDLLHPSKNEPVLVNLSEAIGDESIQNKHWRPVIDATITGFRQQGWTVTE